MIHRDWSSDVCSSDLANKINQALTELEKDGTYDRIVRKWFKGIPGFNLHEIEKYGK